jgi:hypothetical protein
LFQETTGTQELVSGFRILGNKGLVGDTFNRNIFSLEATGRRKSVEPVVLAIATAEAYAAGVCFYEGNEKVWLADAILRSSLGSDRCGSASPSGGG